MHVLWINWKSINDGDQLRPSRHAVRLAKILALPLPSADWLGLNRFDLSPVILSQLQRMDEPLAVVPAVLEIIILVHNEPQAPDFFPREYNWGVAAETKSVPGRWYVVGAEVSVLGAIAALVFVEGGGEESGVGGELV